MRDTVLFNLIKEEKKRQLDESIKQAELKGGDGKCTYQ